MLNFVDSERFVRTGFRNSAVVIWTSVDIWTAADKCKFEGRKHWNHLTDSSTGVQYQSVMLLHEAKCSWSLTCS